MAGIVPLIAPNVSGHEGIVSAATVDSPIWERLGKAANAILGGSACLVPICAPDVAIAAASSATLRFNIHPRREAAYRSWIFFVDTTSGEGRLTITFPTGFVASLRASPLQVCRVIHEPIAIGSRSNLEAAANVVIANASGGAAVTVRLIGCYEHARSELESGVTLESLRSRTPIYDGGAEGKSVGGVSATVGAEEFWKASRRCGLFAASPFYTRASGTYGSPLEPITVLGRKKYRTSTTATMRCAAYVRSDVTTAGDVRFSMTSGATLTLTIPANTSGAWVRGNIAIDCDDFSDDYGRRASRNDKVTIEVRRTSGAANVYLDHVCGGEERV